MGRFVLFYVNIIKNVSKSDEGEWLFLCINFLLFGQGVGCKDDQLFEDVLVYFVRSLIFCLIDGDWYIDIVNQIVNFKCEVVKKEQEKKDLEDVIEQDKLVEIRSKRILFLIIVIVINLCFRLLFCCFG